LKHTLHGFIPQRFKALRHRSSDVGFALSSNKLLLGIEYGTEI